MIQEQRALIKMPEVVGLPLRKAKLLVENAGLAVDAVVFMESYDERDTVLTQKPARGQMIYAGEKVTLGISRESYVKWLVWTLIAGLITFIVFFPLLRRAEERR